MNYQCHTMIVCNYLSIYVSSIYKYNVYLFVILWLGQPLTKKHSYSLITPPTLTGYTEFFRYCSRIYNFL